MGALSATSQSDGEDNADLKPKQEHRVERHPVGPNWHPNTRMLAESCKVGRRANQKQIRQISELSPSFALSQRQKLPITCS